MSTVSSKASNIIFSKSSQNQFKPKDSDWIISTQSEKTDIQTIPVNKEYSNSIRE